jgi:hypothetical protein
MIYEYFDGVYCVFVLSNKTTKNVNSNNNTTRSIDGIQF